MNQWEVMNMDRCREWLVVCLAILTVFNSATNGRDLTSKRDPARRALAQLETLKMDENGMMEVYYDYVEDGRLKGGKSIMPVPELELATLAAMPPYNAYTLIDNGPSENRIDLVFVGDGYTADEMDTYLDHVQNVITGFFNDEPLDAYVNYFNVHVVEVVSNESGVDEPDNGIYRDTALDMTFNCNNVPRRLCVDYGRAWTAAENARDVDVVLVLANSTRYGGAGYSKLSTLAGGNDSAVELALHEYGHSFAGLADEYHYGDGATYTGPEPTQPNVSIYDADAQLAQQRKWYCWLDLAEVGTFEGAMYKQYGIYRPTQSSKMKVLGYPFGPVNVEQFVFAIYDDISPIDAVSPVSNDVFWSTIVFSVTVQRPVTHTVSIEWQIDGVPIYGANEVNFCPDSYLATNTVQILTARVVDGVLLVRDENKRENLLTDQQNWLVWKASAADFTGDGFVNMADLSEMILRWLLNEPDYDIAPPGGNDIVNFQDFAILAKDWLAEPPGQASNPNPADGATGVSTTADLGWTAGSDAVSHDVYFGTSNPPPFIRNQTAITFDPGTMTMATTYYWRIDEVNPWGTITGEVWRFTTGGPIR